jgi:isopentenyl diphosphate isomerase/L-lactate dehydrogenase-like FMN-dependent dehydrogenase
MPVAAPTIGDLRRDAQRRLPRLAFDFVDGGADDEVTLRDNVAAFDRVRLAPRVLRDVARRDQTLELFGRELSLPVLIAPTGMARVAGRGGDVAGVRAAGRAGTAFTLSTMSNDALEAVAPHTTAPLWLQLYLWPRREVVTGLLDRARRAGVHALMVTVDVPVIGRRVRDVRNGFTVPLALRPRVAADVLRHPRWLRSMYPPPTFGNLVAEGVRTPGEALAHAELVTQLLAHPAATWADLRWVREQWEGPLLIKGVLTAADADEAIACGVDGIVVSNHGGRQLDGVPATLDALPAVVEAAAGRAEVLLDGGVRRGTDVVKALALGARAVLVGRPWLYGLAAGGEDGVVHALELLRSEVDRALALLGCTSLAGLDAAVLHHAVGGAAERPGAGAAW